MCVYFLDYADDEPALSPRMTVDKRNNNRITHVYDNKLARPSKKRETKNNRREKDQNEAYSSVGRISTVDNDVDSSCSPFSDEDYIVFCFREDGAFDVIKDGKCVKSKPPSDIYGRSKNSRPVNRKVHIQPLANCVFQ